jgi:hypothetical protein
VHHAARPDLAHDRREVRVGRALVQKHRPVELPRQRELRPKRLPLRLARREIPVVVQAALAHGDDAPVGQQRPQRGQRVRPERARLVRVHARGTRQPGVRVGELQRAAAGGQAGAGHDHVPDALRARAGQHGGQVLAERAVRQVGADIDQRSHDAVLPGDAAPALASA